MDFFIIIKTLFLKILKLISSDAPYLIRMSLILSYTFMVPFAFKPKTIDSKCLSTICRFDRTAKRSCVNFFSSSIKFDRFCLWQMQFVAVRGGTQFKALGATSVDKTKLMDFVVKNRFYCTSYGCTYVTHII